MLISLRSHKTGQEGTCARAGWPTHSQVGPGDWVLEPHMVTGMEFVHWKVH